MRRWWRGAAHAGVVVIAFTLLYGAFFAPVLLTGRLLAPGDASNLSLPHLYCPRTPWSSLIYSGFPVMADPHNLMWYPPAMFFSLIPGAWNGFVLTAYVLASSFTYGYVYRLTGCRSAALVGGVIYGMSGFFMAHLGHTNMIHSCAWVPLLIWSLEELRERQCGLWVLAGAVAVGNSVLAGHPQYPLNGLCLGGCYVLARGWGAPSGWARYAARSLGAVALGLGFAAVQLLPMIEVQGQSLRAAMDYGTFISYSLPPRQLPQFILPYLYGGFWNPVTRTITPYLGQGVGLTELIGYVGVLPLLLAAVGFARAPRDRRVAWFWLAAAMVTVWLALGKSCPLNRVLFHVPVYNKFRIPARHFFELALAVSVLAGFGVAALSRLDLIARLRTLRRGTAALAGLVLLALLTFFCFDAVGKYTRHLPEPERFREWLMPWRNPALAFQLVLVTAGLLALWSWAYRPNRGTAALLLAGVVLDLGSFGWFYEWQYGSMSPDQFRMPGALAKYQERLARTGQRLLPLVADGPPETAPPNRSRLWHIPSALGYSPLALTAYSRLLGIDYAGFSSYDCLKPGNRALDILATRYILAPRALLADKGSVARELADRDRWSYVEDMSQTAVFENRKALPRAWLVSELVCLPPDVVLQTIQASKFPDGSVYDPRKVALVQEPVAFKVEKPDPAARVDVVELSDGRLEVQASSRTPAFLVLSDVYYPGWRATVNGQPAPVLRTNGVLRGVRIPAGRSIVCLEFRPLWLYAGAAVSVCSLLLAVGFLGVSWSRSARLPDPPRLLTEEQQS